MSSYKVPDLAPGEIHREEEVIRRSRFIVSIARVQGPEQAKAFIDRIRAEHSDATHNCWAFQAGPAGSTAFAGCSDDGEPKGTAGRPMLTVLLHCGVGEIAAVVTRYFGGTLLGTGGLVHAYQGMVKKGLETLPVTERVETARILVEMEHRFYEHAVSVIGRCQGAILERNFAADVTLLVETAEVQAEKLMSALGEISAGRIRTKRQSDAS